MRFDDLRHSCVTLLLLLGVPPHIVQAIVGHADIARDDDASTPTHRWRDQRKRSTHLARRARRISVADLLLY